MIKLCYYRDGMLHRRIAIYPKNKSIFGIDSKIIPDVTLY